MYHYVTVLFLSNHRYPVVLYQRFICLFLVHYSGKAIPFDTDL
jgi:hypothetical protein